MTLNSTDCWKFSFAIKGINYIFKYVRIETVIVILFHNMTVPGPHSLSLWKRATYILFKISPFVFHSGQKVAQFWKDMKVNEWWHYPFKFCQRVLVFHKWAWMTVLVYAGATTSHRSSRGRRDVCSDSCLGIYWFWFWMCLGQPG